jgi:hypothetical protein
MQSLERVTAGVLGRGVGLKSDTEAPWVSDLQSDTGSDASSSVKVLGWKPGTARAGVHARVSRGGVSD